MPTDSGEAKSGWHPVRGGGAPRGAGSSLVPVTHGEQVYAAPGPGDSPVVTNPTFHGDIGGGDSSSSKSAKKKKKKKKPSGFLPSNSEGQQSFNKKMKTLKKKSKKGKGKDAGSLSAQI